MVPGVELRAVSHVVGPCVWLVQALPREGGREGGREEGGVGVYEVRNHDVHHWFPESNYGQYLMLWDHVFGSFKPYPEKQGGVNKGE